VRVPTLAVVAVVAAGCVQAPESERAKEAVEAEATGARRVDCTSRSMRWFREGPPAERFLCVARGEHGRCDRYVVQRSGDRFEARRTERDTADCTLPSG
jgi:hypothetical protein